MQIDITFPEKKKVNAAFDGFLVHTDQPVDNEGDGTAPGPFDLFLASIGTCAGYYVKTFCDQRKLNTEGLKITEVATWDEATHALKEISLTLHLPKDFPEKYKAAIVAAVNSCSVKKALLNPPEIKVQAI